MNAGPDRDVCRRHDGPPRAGVCRWPNFFFWKTPEGGLLPRSRSARIPPGLPDLPEPGSHPPARSARRPSPRSTRRWHRTRESGYLYFLAIPDGDGPMPSRRRSMSTTPTSESTVTNDDLERRPGIGGLAPSDRLRRPAHEGRPGPPRERPTGRPRPPPAGCGPGWRRPASTAYFGVQHEHMRYLTAIAENRGRLGRQFREVPRHRGRGVHPGGQPLHDPGRPGGARDPPVRVLPRAVRALAGAAEGGRGPSRRGRGGLRPPGHVGLGLVAATPNVAARPNEAGGAGSAGQGAGRARAGGRRVRDRRPGAGVAPALDPAGRHRGRAGPRVADPDGRRENAWPSTSPASAGPEAALPHRPPPDPAGAPRHGSMLFDFGAQVAGYRINADLFVGDPTERDLGVYEVVAASQGAAIAAPRSRGGPARRAAAERPGDRWRRSWRHRGQRQVAGVRARPRPRDRAGHPRRSGGARPRRHGLLDRTGHAPRGRDGRPDRGSRNPRCRGRAPRARHAVPVRRDR